MGSEKKKNYFLALFVRENPPLRSLQQTIAALCAVWLLLTSVVNSYGGIYMMKNCH